MKQWDTEEVLAFVHDVRPWRDLSDAERAEWCRRVKHVRDNVVDANGERWTTLKLAELFGLDDSSLYLRFRRSEDVSAPERAEPNSRVGRAANTLKNPDSARDILADPEVRQSVRKALDTHYQESPKPVAAPERSEEPLELLSRFRRVHKDVDRIIELVLDGKGVVSDAERAALIEEARWLRAASEHIETGLDAGSLEQSLRQFQEEYL